jgi:hypothetical protein
MDTEEWRQDGPMCGQHVRPACEKESKLKTSSNYKESSRLNGQHFGR